MWNLKKKKLKKNSQLLWCLAPVDLPHLHLFTVSQPHRSLGPRLVLPQDLCTFCFLCLKGSSFRTLLQLPRVISNPSLSYRSVGSDYSFFGPLTTCVLWAWGWTFPLSPSACCPVPLLSCPRSLHVLFHFLVDSLTTCCASSLRCSPTCGQ